MGIPRQPSSSLVALLVAGTLVLGCGSSGSPSNQGSGGSSGSGGAVGSGGATASGGATGTGGVTASGGAVGSGGVTASGGVVGSGGKTASGGAVGTGGVTASGGTSSSGGSGSNGGRGGTATGSGGQSAGGKSGSGGAGGATGKFSFFMTSLAALTRLSKAAGAPNDQGFGGDLRYGETGAGAGLRGADKICTEIAEASMPGAGAKTWRAFLSAVEGPVHAKDRIGAGPWYDRKGRLVASNLTQLLMQRPGDADTAIKNDLPNEDGIPNHNPDLTGNVDNHDVLTGTNTMGMLYATDPQRTCMDWTSSAGMGAGGSSGGGGSGGFGRAAGPWCGHSWPAGSGMNWMSALAEGGCQPGINLKEQGGPMQGVYTVGTGGGYGAFYCFALTP